MKGLVAEGQEAIDARGNPDVKDAALIAAAQRVEQTARSLSTEDIARIRQPFRQAGSGPFAGGDFVAEEKAADHKIKSSWRKLSINEKAGRA